MGGNVVAGGVLLDLHDLQLTGDPAPQAGVATEVTVKFKFSQPFYRVVWRRANWPWTVKVYAEGYGGRWLAGEGRPQEWTWTLSGTCAQANPDFTEKVPVTLNREGVYKLSAIVELDKNAGFVMGYADEEVQISVWTPR
jgi:hypothetical protein